MIVVSDASAILNLAVIGQLDLVINLYGTVIVPQVVREEIQENLSADLDHELKRAIWLETRQVVDNARAISLELELDIGEAEAIALAIELKADLVLIDERKGRNVARRFGLKFVGLLGILLEAKGRGLIEELKPLMDALIGKAGFWISPKLYDQVLKLAGE